MAEENPTQPEPVDEAAPIEEQPVTSELTPETAETPTTEQPTPEAPPETAPTATEQPSPTAYQPPPATAQPQPDEWDREYDTAIQELAEDDMLSPAQKRAEKLKLMDLQEQRQARRAQRHDTEEDRIRNDEARRNSVERGVVDRAWDEAVRESQKELGAFNQGAAMILYRQKITAAKAAPKPAAEPKNNPTPAPARSITPSGGRIPGSNRHTPPPPAKKSAADEVLELLGPLNKSSWP